MQTLKAFCYLRVSSIGQSDGDGFTRQELACREYAAAQDLEITEVFRDSMTGKSDMEDRPAMAQMLVALEENGVRTVLIEKLDRVARDLLVQETIIGDMIRRGYTVVSTCEPDLCSKDPSRVLIRQIFGALAQYDRSMIVLKTRAARDRIRARTGRCEGRKPYGEYPGESGILIAMKEMRAAGLTYWSIANKLNADGKLARSGKPWCLQSVGKILTR